MIGSEELNRIGTDMRISGLEYPNKIEFDVNNVNKLLIYPNEPFRNLLARAILVYHLQRLRHRVVLGARVGDLVCDVLDLDTNVNYELSHGKSIDNFQTEEKRFLSNGIRLVVVQVNSFSNDIGWWIEYIRKWIRLQ